MAEHDEQRQMREGMAMGERAGDKPEEVANWLDDAHAADGASVMSAMEPTRASAVAEYLDPETAARILSEMDSAAAAVVLAGMKRPEASMVLAAMDPDDRVDTLSYLPK